MDRRDNSIELKFYCEQRDNRTLYVFDFLSSILGVKCKVVDDVISANIVYTDRHSQVSLNNNQIVIYTNKSDIIWSDLIEDKINHDLNHFDFDIINAVASFLLDEVNESEVSEKCDKHGRLKLEKSFQFRNQLDKFPIVNKYVLEFRRRVNLFLETSLPVLYPEGKSACIILSHDVDIPDKYEELKNYSLFPLKGRGIYFHYRHFLGLLKSFLSDKHKTEFWTFKELMEEEKSLGFKSTSFFATTSRFDKNGHQLDVPYKLGDRYVHVIKEMQNNGFEVGLHASYDAYKSTEKFKSEKLRLEDAMEKECLGLRHHFWHLSENPTSTMRMHERLKFKYDSSLAFNDGMGFRYNVALPFFPFDIEESRKIKVLQIPTFCMDGNLFYEDNPSPKDAVQLIDQYIQAIINCSGVGSIDWHTRTSFPKGPTYKAWGEAYLELLNHLSKKENIWVTSFEEFYNWWTVGRYA